VSLSAAWAALVGLGLLGACPGGQASRPDGGRRQGSRPMMAIHEEGITRGQGIGFAQAQEAGTWSACLEGLKPGSVEFLGHLEVHRPELGGVRFRMRSNQIRAQAGLMQWTNWCQYLGHLEPGDMVRLVSDVNARGRFRFQLELQYEE
jgi:hypothetical protein